MLFLILFAFDQPEFKPCVVDKCENSTCTIETPEGFVDVDRKDHYYEGLRLSDRECPVWLIDPT